MNAEAKKTPLTALERVEEIVRRRGLVEETRAWLDFFRYRARGAVTADRLARCAKAAALDRWSLSAPALADAVCEEIDVGSRPFPRMSGSLMERHRAKAAAWAGRRVGAWIVERVEVDGRRNFHGNRTLVRCPFCGATRAVTLQSVPRIAACSYLGKKKGGAR